MEGVDQGNPFAEPNLWARSSLLAHIPDVSIQGFPALPEIGTPQTEWPDVEDHDRDASVIPKDDETTWLEPSPPNPTLENIEEPRTSSEADDAWSISTEDISIARRVPGRSWEQYADPTFREPFQYLSEASIATFDAVIRKRPSTKTVGRPLKQHVFLKSLFQLGLGRDSALFAFKADGTFSAKVPDPRMFGLTPECTGSVISRFSQCGQLIRSVKAQIARLYGRQKCPPAGIAAAQTISSILLELDTQVTAKSPIRSLLQLQAAFKTPFTTLTLLRDVLMSIGRMSADQTVLNYLYDLAKEVEVSEPCLKPLMAQIMSRASEPWLRAVSACIGLRPADATSQALRLLLNEHVTIGQDVVENAEDSIFPRWLSAGDRALVRQIFEGMTLLEHQGRQTLLEGPPAGRPLAWCFSWAGMIQGENQSDQNPRLANDVASILKPLRDLELLSLEPDIDSSGAMQTTYAVFEHNATGSTKEAGLSTVMESLLDGHEANRSVGDPSFEVTAINSFRPVLAARARVINHACLQELFQSGTDPKSGRPLSIAYHLMVLNRFLLMTDGMFTTRLSHALLDPELASAERSKGKVRAGKMGLRLGSRLTWPPASSELQLALMGILTSCFEDDTRSSHAQELPGDLSFALRQLSEDEIQRCLDQGSLEALDFLRVQYRPQPPLHAIITQPILEKYDAVQRLLLRITRLVFVVNHSCRFRLRDAGKSGSSSKGALRFAHAAHHFVTAFADYLLNTAIGANWAHFTSEMAELETALSQSKADITESRGVAYVRSAHERTLDNIMCACLLRRRHEQVRGLFDDILRLILQFAAMQEYQEAAVEDLYAKFKKQVTVFVTVCKGLGERKEYTGREEDGLQALVTRLTMNDFYSSNVERALRL